MAKARTKGLLELSEDLVRDAFIRLVDVVNLKQNKN
jgi:hypothetical protein